MRNSETFKGVNDVVLGSDVPAVCFASSAVDAVGSGLGQVQLRSGDEG